MMLLLLRLVVLSIVSRPLLIIIAARSRPLDCTWDCWRHTNWVGRSRYGANIFHVPTGASKQFAVEAQHYQTGNIKANG